MNDFSCSAERPLSVARDEVRRAILASDPEAYAQTCEALVDVEHKDPDYGKIVAPAVLVAGDMEVISPVQRSRDVAELLAGPTWVDIVRSGHQQILEDIQGVAQAVQKLLSGVGL